MILMFTVNRTALLLNHNQRDIGLEFLAQLGGDELQEILKEAGITNAVHRYEHQQFQGTGVFLQVIISRCFQVSGSHSSDYGISDIVLLRHWMVFRMICFLTAGFRCAFDSQRLMQGTLDISSHCDKL